MLWNVKGSSEKLRKVEEMLKKTETKLFKHITEIEINVGYETSNLKV